MIVLPAWAEARNILLIRLDNLGDVLVSTPAFHAVRESLPGARLTLLASPVGAQVGRLNPDIDEVMVYDAPWMDPWQRLRQDSAREQAMIATIRERGFDAAIIFTSFRQSSLPAAYLCYLADIPLRGAASIDGPGSLLTTRYKHPERMMHEVERGLDLVAALGLETAERRLVLQVPESARCEAGRTIATHAANGGPIAVVHPGCSMPARTYPWEMYADVADSLIAELGATVFLTGTESERDLVECIQGRMQTSAVSLAGELAFPVLCGLIEAADITVTNNTGPMHIAAAVGTPVVALFALTNPPEQWGPWMVPHRQLYHEVPCRLCYSRVCPYGHECLRLVTPHAVLGAVRDLLGETADTPQAVVGGLH